MARKYEIITQLYERTVAELADTERWQRFLATACRNYKLSFDEQVLLFAQRPDATAVLPIEGEHGWNKRFGRWVNRGATGIAMFDKEHTGRSRLKYYFDISDTHESRFAVPVPIWQMQPEFEPEVIEALGNTFGDLEDALNDMRTEQLEGNQSTDVVDEVLLKVIDAPTKRVRRSRDEAR